MFQEKQIRVIQKLSKGNFRTVKKLVRTVCEIIDIAQKSRIKEFENVDNKTLTMAAIDIGLIDVK
jgi:Holliday junction resolvasome RuvABC ATP-dependent DNA helicase subunit